MSSANTNTTIPVQVIIASLWTARMLSGFLGDIIRFLVPPFLEELLDGTVDVETTPELALTWAIFMSIPIFMVPLSVMIQSAKTNRRMNILISGFFTVFDFGFFAATIFVFKDYAFEIYLGFIYMLYSALIFWQAWKWEVY